MVESPNGDELRMVVEYDLTEFVVYFSNGYLVSSKFRLSLFYEFKLHSSVGEKSITSSLMTSPFSKFLFLGNIYTRINFIDVKELSEM